MEKLYIYVLKCPEGNIRYVGKTNNLKKDCILILMRQKKGKGRRYVLNQIHGLIILNLKPLIEVIEECNSNNWAEREKYWISYYSNTTTLCNLSEGGEGVGHNDSTKSKIKNALVGRKKK